MDYKKEKKMARYTGPSWKQSRRLKFSVLENGKELQKRNYAPGQHGQRRAKLSEYALQLQEKQDKVKRILSEMNNIDRYKNVEIFLNIFNGITIAFITFIIAFTFRNKILG